MAEYSFSPEYLDALIAAIDGRCAERRAETQAACDEAFARKFAAAPAACGEQTKGGFDDEDMALVHQGNRRTFLRYGKELLDAHRGLTAEGLLQLYDEMAKRESGSDREEGEGQ